MNIRFRAIWAVLKRNFQSYFGNPTGYVFITMFVVATGFVAFFSENFFASNVADLAFLNQWMPWLLVIFVPAVTMGVWAEERKLGTHELLLTLPVRDVEVVLGKYFAALAVFTVSLAFSLAHAVVLNFLGRPDMGLLISNYIGYWLLGAALIPLGLVASSITSNTTVAFILGTAFCAAGIFAEKLAILTLGPGSRLAKGVGILTHFEGTGLGVISLPDLLFFILLGISILYINIIMVGRRHWWGGRDGPHMGWHQLARGLAIIVAGLSVGLLAGRWLPWARVDLTSERINSPAPQTVALLQSLPGEQMVYIRAFVSEEVPEEYVPVRETVLRTLKAIQSTAGNRIIVQINHPELYSQMARDADELYGIKARPVRESAEGRQRAREVYMGVAVTCGPRQEVIPFFDRGLSVEYELARAVRVAANSERRKVGILRTQAQIMGGGGGYPGMGGSPPWSITDELRKQYEVVEVNGEAPIGGIDVLIAVQPVQLTGAQQANFENYVMEGKPVLMFVDPLPLAMSSQFGPAFPGNDMKSLLSRMGVTWDKDEVACDVSVRIERFQDLPEAFVVVSSTVKGFNTNEEITRDLSRMILLGGGSLNRAREATTEFVPLLRTGPVSGLVPAMTAFGRLRGSDSSALPFLPSGMQYTLAARVTGPTGKYQPQEADPAGAAQPPMPGMPAPPAILRPATTQPIISSINAVVVSDLDMISDLFFNLRRTGDRDVRFDNITFVLNCVDYLAGDKDLIALRSRQPRYRTLEAIDARRKEFREKMVSEEKDADTSAEKQRNEAQARFEKAVAEIEKRKDLDDLTKSMMTEQVRQAEQKRLDAQKSEIESSRMDRISRAQRDMYLKVQQIENRARQWAIVLPSLPPILIGLIIFSMQKMNERRGVPLARSMRKTP